MGPYAVIWQPTSDCPDVAKWLKENDIKPHSGWIIMDNGDGSYSHELKESMPILRFIREQS